MAEVKCTSLYYAFNPGENVFFNAYLFKALFYKMLKDICSGKNKFFEQFSLIYASKSGVHILENKILLCFRKK